MQGDRMEAVQRKSRAGELLKVLPFQARTLRTAQREHMPSRIISHMSLAM